MMIQCGIRYSVSSSPSSSSAPTELQSQEPMSLPWVNRGEMYSDTLKSGRSPAIIYCRSVEGNANETGWSQSNVICLGVSSQKVNRFR